MNKHDTERIAGMLEALGSKKVDTTEEADFQIYMTCCVREKADERLMGQVSSIKNYPVRPGSSFDKRYIAIGGCIGQRDGNKLLEQLGHVDVVFGTHNLDALPDLLEGAISSGVRESRTIDGVAEFHDTLPEDREHAWAAWLPITVGCNNFCTYCIVPYVRGREVSRPFDEIVEAAQGYVDSGVKEITLLGQNVNSYGRDLYGQPRFSEVLDAVASTGIQRLRFATSHPKDLTDEVIEKFATLDNLMPALHLPVQSGSDSILKAMHRVYDRAHYLQLIDKLRAACPDIALSTDVIVGFPGETEADFEDTLSLIEQVGYTQVFSFIYSKRAGTPAAEIEDDTPKEVIQQRFNRLLSAVEQGAFAANQAEADKVVPVLFEGLSKGDASVLTGKTPKNQTVHVSLPDNQSASSFAGSIQDVHIDEARTWYLRGSLLS